MLTNEDKVDLGPFLKQFVMRNPFKIDELENQETENVTDLSINRRTSRVATFCIKYNQRKNYNIDNRQTKPLNYSSSHRSSSSENADVDSLEDVKNPHNHLNSTIEIKIEKEDNSYSDASTSEIHFNENKETKYSILQKPYFEQLCPQKQATNYHMRRRCHKDSNEAMRKRAPYLMSRLLLARARSCKLQRKLRHNIRTLSELECNYAFLRQHFVTLHQTFQQISKKLIFDELACQTL